MGGMNKKATVAAVASILLVAAVVAVVVGSTKRASQEASTGSTSRAVKGICSPTDYKETCEKSLAGANSSDPKELVKLAIDVTVTNIQGVLQRSALLKEAATDPGTKDAYAVCEEVLQNAVDDLKRSVEKVGEFSIVKLGEYMEDLKTWLSAVITNQETCVDAFENSSGDAGEKMKSLLKVARELSSNGLAMVTEMSSMFTTFTFGSRKMFPSSTTPALAAAPALPPTPAAQAPATPTGADQSTPAATAAPPAPPTPIAPVAAAAAPVVVGAAAPPPAFAEKRIPVGGAASLKPNIVVAQDGSGQFKTVSEAVNSLPMGSNPVVIFVKAGLYDEIVSIPKGVNMVTLVGEGPMRTRITGNKNFAAGVKTYHTATVAVNSEDFLAMDIAFENTAGAEGHQAVALRVSGDRAVFYNVAIDGYQDTLYAHNYRQYYRDCSVSGTIDFVFGDSLSIFQNCTFIVRKPAPNQACMVTAQGRIDPRSQGSFVIQNCNITAEPAFIEAQPPHKAYLGRPWKELSRTIIMYSNIEGSIAPEGWSPWAGTFALDTCYYAEFENKGAGADTANRVQWAGIKKITLEEAQSWTGGVAYGGDAWITEAGVPYVPTLY